MAAFAHPSEAAVADLFNGYGIRWEYEPTTFVLDRDDQGQTVSAFTPDFYLPDFDVYVEVTTMRQDLVTRKHRKIRRLTELHPEVTVKMLYRRDILKLDAKYSFADAA